MNRTPGRLQEFRPINPRSISDERLEALKRSIRDLPDMLSMRELLVYPLDGRYIVLGGNMRLRACLELGYAEMPCKVIPPSTPAEKLRAIIMQDNNEYGEMDWDMVASEWDTDELEDWGVELPEEWGCQEDERTDEAKEDDFSEEDADKCEERVSAGEVWQLGDHRLMCGDCNDAGAVSLLMENAKADLYLTDPPYNVDYTGGGKNKLKIANDNMEEAQFQEFLTTAFINANRHLKQGGAFYVWYANAKGLYFKTAVKQVGWDLKQVLIWVKNSIVLGRQDYQWKHEPCLYGWKPGASHYFIDRRDIATVHEDAASINVNGMKKEQLKQLVLKLLNEKMPTDVIRLDKPQTSSEHPTMKPVALMGTLVGNSTRKGEIVLDTFGGSGSTLIACEQLGRKCYMMELSPHYCDVIIARWEKFTGLQAIKTC